MSARRRKSRRSGRVKVVPQPRGGWAVVNHRGVVVSEHASATEAELAAAATLHDGDQLVVYDRYHRCHAVPPARLPLHREQPLSGSSRTPRRRIAERQLLCLMESDCHLRPSSRGIGSGYALL